MKKSSHRPHPRPPFRRLAFALAAAALGLVASRARSQPLPEQNLAYLTPGRTGAINALWNENPLEVQFRSSRRIVVAEVAGPAEITMIHFAYARTQLGRDPARRLNEQIGNGAPLTRDLLLRIYWDGESSPSVDCPLVDFFCDPDGARETVNTAFVNVHRGFNAYFPMPFRRSARIELVYEGAVEPGVELARMMPCYSYVCYRTLPRLPENLGYFHASWRQEALPLGRREYVALEAAGRGKFVGWNVTIHSLAGKGVVVDENEKFYLDGETTPAIEFQGLEDSFGFSWGFGPSENMFPLTGYFPYRSGAAAYRFFVADAVSFQKSLRISIGFGATEKGFRARFSTPESTVQLSSTAYWYQEEPHAPFPAMPSAADRAPASSPRGVAKP